MHIRLRLTSKRVKPVDPMDDFAKAERLFGS